MSKGNYYQFKLVILLTTCVSLMSCAIVTPKSISPSIDFQNSRANEVWMSPISLSANRAGIRITPELLERLSLKTGLKRTELEKIGLKEGELSQLQFRKVLENDLEGAADRFSGYFDRNFSPSSDFDGEFWARIKGVRGFINDAIKFSNFDSEKSKSFMESLEVAAEDGSDTRHELARSETFETLTLVRRDVARKARAYSELAEALRTENDSRYFESNVELTIDIRTNVVRPTISPISIVSVSCESGQRYEEMVFSEKSRVCDDFGVCRMEFFAGVGAERSIDSIQNENSISNLYSELRDDGRSFLDSCTIQLELLIDGIVTKRNLLGKYTSATSAKK